MRNFFKLSFATLIALEISSTTVLAGPGTTSLGAELPFGGGLGLVGLAAAGIIGGIWIARSKR